MNPENPALVDLDSIRSDLGEDYLREFVAVFLEETPKQIETIKAALNHSDLSAIAAEAHKLKGNFGYITATDLGKISLDIERAATAGQTDPLPDLIAKLDADYKAVEKELIRIKNGLPE